VGRDRISYQGLEHTATTAFHASGLPVRTSFPFKVLFLTSSGSNRPSGGFLAVLSGVSTNGPTSFTFGRTSQGGVGSRVGSGGLGFQKVCSVVASSGKTGDSLAGAPFVCVYSCVRVCMPLSVSMCGGVCMRVLVYICTSGRPPLFSYHSGPRAVLHDVFSRSTPGADRRIACPGAERP